MLTAALLVPFMATAADKRSDHDPGADFSGMATYAWMTRPIEVPDVERKAPVLDRLLHETVAEEMEARGVPAAPGDQADLLFIYYVDPRENLADYSRRYVTEDMNVWLLPLKPYKETLSVVVMDGISRENGRLVWRGVFAMKLTEPWKLAKKIRKVTAGLIAGIPIPKR